MSDFLNPFGIELRLEHLDLFFQLHSQLALAIDRLANLDQLVAQFVDGVFGVGAHMQAVGTRMALDALVGRVGIARLDVVAVLGLNSFHELMVGAVELGARLHVASGRDDALQLTLYGQQARLFQLELINVLGGMLEYGSLTNGDQCDARRWK